MAATKRISIRLLRTLLPIWQEILRLQDWNIDLKVVNRMDEGEGYAIADSKYKMATIAIKLNNKWEAENILVHEMLHVAMSGFHDPIEEGSKEDTLLETFVDQTAKALVALRRKSAQ